MSVLGETEPSMKTHVVSQVSAIQLRSTFTNSKSTRLHFWKQIIRDRWYVEVETKAAKSVSPSERTGSNAGGRTAIKAACLRGTATFR